VEQNGFLSKPAVGTLRSFGGDTDRAEDFGGGVLALVPDNVGLLSTETGIGQADERNEEVGGGVLTLVPDNVGLYTTETGTEQVRVVLEKTIGELGNIGGVTEALEGEKEEFFPKVSDPVIQLEPCQGFELQYGKKKEVGCIGGEGFSSAGFSRKLEGSLELSSYVVQSECRSEIVEGGVGEEVEGFGPFSIMPLAVELDKDSSSEVSPRWVLERVKGYYKRVGVSCDQYEDKLLALFEKIESRRAQSLADSLAMVTTASGVKGQREIKRLDCSINYDKKGEQSNRRRGNGRGMSCVNEA
jgi:hypothetical protein